ncbi:MAG: hypothetical protein NVSMB17_05480 [Candidatus Dormibacteria bacterium]
MRARRGQATVEFALIAPLVALLIGGSLQVGVLVSDQMNLTQAAYEGALWAQANPATATAGASGTIAQHVYAQLCGGATAAPSSGGTRFCQHVAGSPDLSVDVTNPLTPTADRGFGWPVTDALADDNGNCDGPLRGWVLQVSPASATISPGVTKTFTVTLVPSGSGGAPTVRLNVSGYPGNLANGNPSFTPPTITPSAPTATLAIATRTDTTPGQYTLVISGQDQCAAGPLTGAVVANLVVSGVPPLPIAVPVTPTIGSVNPNNLCGDTPQTLTITGSNFSNGTVVTVGTTGAISVNVTGSTQILATFPPLATGTFNVTVTLVGGGSATLQNAITKVANCTASSPPVAATNACAGSAGSHQTVIKITWYEPLAINLVGAAGAGSFKLTALQVGFCQ